MNSVKSLLKNIKPIQYFLKGRSFLNDPYFVEATRRYEEELMKRPFRTEIINFLLSYLNRETNYLEIGVRNPAHNFNHIKSAVKYSVDPGVEFKENPVDFMLTSDEFFKKLSQKKILSPDIKFDVIFIDGLHLADQVDRDIINSLNFIKDDGFVVLHDCNPPTEWHARSEYRFINTPASANWNGTTWKAFLKWRCDASVHSCCVDTDWGVGILSKKQMIGKNLEKKSQFFEYAELEENRSEYLGLISFDNLKKRLTD